MTQMVLPGCEAFMPVWVCCLCEQPATLFGQYSPFFDWGVCKACSIAYPYPIDVIVPSTRRNNDKAPYMIDPDAPAERRTLRVECDERVRCTLDPTRAERPVVKYNITAKEIRNPVRRSRRAHYTRMMHTARHNLTCRQMSLPYCERCGCAHDRHYEMLPGMIDYWSKCQRCADEESVEALFRHRSIFGNDDAETILDRFYQSHVDLFDRGVLPDYWFHLAADNDRAGKEY